MKRILLLTMFGAMLLAAACGGGDKPSASGGGDAPKATATAGDSSSGGGSGGGGRSAAAALRQAADKTKEVEGFSGTFEMDMGFGGESMSIEGDMAFEAPDRMYMTMNMFGIEMELLMLAPDMYIRMPGEGWFSIDAETAGIDREQFEQYLQNQGPIDFEGLLDGLEDVEELASEYIEGELHRHYRGTFDIEAMMDELPEGVVDEEALELVGDALEPMPFDVWINDETGLPRRVAVEMDMSIPPLGTISMDMTMEYESFEGPFDIPDAPTDARPFDPSALGG